jgi:hypothetical protein
LRQPDAFSIDTRREACDVPPARPPAIPSTARSRWSSRRDRGNVSSAMSTCVVAGGIERQSRQYPSWCARTPQRSNILGAYGVLPRRRWTAIIAAASRERARGCAPTKRRSQAKS